MNSASDEHIVNNGFDLGHSPPPDNILVTVEDVPITPSSIIPQSTLERFKFKNTITSGGSIRIRVSNNDKKFIKEHDCVSGFIDVKLTSTLDSSVSKKLVLRCKAFERHSKKNESNEYEVVKEHVYFVDYMLIKDFMNEDLDIGQHSYPFSYTLPDRIPTSTFHERHDTQYSICYKFKAFLVTEQHEIKVNHQHHEHNAHTSVVAAHHPKEKKVVSNEQSLHTCKIEKSCILFVSELYPTIEGVSGKSTMHFETSKKYLFSAKKLKVGCNFARNTFRMYDDDIVFSLQVNNQSTKTVNSIHVALIQEFRHIETEEKEEGGLKFFESKPAEEKENIVMFEKQIDKIVLSEENYETKITFEIPSYRSIESKAENSEQYDNFENRAFWMASINNSKLIQVSYNIVVTCAVGFGADAVLTCPIYIKPSLTGLKYPKKE
ncbi:predicted protein [Naegleria gruberi]|uniref:Predicted protein n=1 Tax=Naegleria gruberi TaxID=5762 RepID=D2VKD2_NAEGR|nr:uncharacterized protein NAEGRDRAFT_50265 [Naegleria gruberi]EFC42665.1 predicted protein [Naegleria gruberi]|eukprot:XP_002675409.1 predicted protein [Naegleria gruberi strain NEG-M]